MAFPERLLSEDELICDLQPHWLTLVVPVLITVAVMVAVKGGLGGHARRRPAAAGPDSRRRARAGGAARAPWSAGCCWSTTHFVLTTERLIFRSGVVGKFGREIPLERINDGTFSQSLFERMIGAGDLLLESAGEHGQSRFSNIRDPEAVQLEIYRQMEANDRRRAGYATTQHHPAVADRTHPDPRPQHPEHPRPPRRPGTPGKPPRPRRHHRRGVPAHEARAPGPDVAGRIVEVTEPAGERPEPALRALIQQARAGEAEHRAKAREQGKLFVRERLALSTQAVFGFVEDGL